MKKTIRLLVGTFVAIGAAHQLQAQGYIVPNGVTSEDIGGVNLIRVIQNPSTLDYTGFAFFPGTGDSFTYSHLLDEGVRVFFVSANDPFGLSQIQSQTYPELLQSSSYVLPDAVPFYVGLYTGASIPPPYPSTPPIFYTDPVYGWAQLVNNGGTVQLLGGALGYNTAGIYAGTQTLIPEPTAVSLFGLGVLGLMWHRWKSSRS